jgi:hypothetical protein
LDRRDVIPLLEPPHGGGLLGGAAELVLRIGAARPFLRLEDVHGLADRRQHQHTWHSSPVGTAHREKFIKLALDEMLPHARRIDQVQDCLLAYDRSMKTCSFATQEALRE